MKIAGSAVLVTGANRGIGRALVEEALKRGAMRVYAGTRLPFDHADPRVTRVTLDVTSAAQIQEALRNVESLDILINNAGIALYDDLTDRTAIEKQLAVNLFGMYDVTQAFLPLLTRSRGAIVNNLSLTALAAVPVIPSYSISKAAAFSLTQSLRALLAGRGVSVHAVLTGPTDTDMNRGFDIPKSSPELVARGIFDGVESGEEDIFPDPISQSMAESWHNSAPKAMERQNASFVTQSASKENKNVKKNPDLTISFVVDQTPREVFDAITNVRAWWSGAIEGRTDVLGEFKYHYQDIHRSTMRITELVPGEKVVWHVVEAELNFVKDKNEWTGTDVVFDIARKGDKTEVRFTHVGLVPSYECFDVCSDAWSTYINGSLRNLIVNGKGRPDQNEEISKRHDIEVSSISA